MQSDERNKEVRVEGWSDNISQNFYERLRHTQENTYFTKSYLKDARNDIDRYHNSIYKLLKNSFDELMSNYRVMYFFGLLQTLSLVYIAFKMD